jgi:outer membrane protein assembly factor BamB
MARHATAAAVYILLAGVVFADDWPMAFHDSSHSGRSSEILTAPLTLAWTWKDSLPYDNDTKWHPAPFPWLPIYYRGRIYIQGGLNANRLFAIDPATGKTVWEADNPGYTANGNQLFQFANYPAALSGRVLSASTDFTISVDATTGGDLRNIYNTNGGWPFGGTALWNGYAIYQFVETDNGAEDLKFVSDPVALAESGPYILPNSANGLFTDYTFRVPASDGNVAYANRLGQLVAWDPPTSLTFWSWGTRNFGASPAVWNHRVFFYASTYGVLAALDGGPTATWTGALPALPMLWTAPIAGAYSPIASEGVVYAGSSDRNFYAIDAQTGVVKWKFSTGAAFTAMQIPAISGSLIFVPGADGVLYGLNKDTGNPVWRYVAGAALGPVVVAGGRLMVSDTAFTLYSFTPAAAAVAPAVTSVSSTRISNAAAVSLTLTGSGFTGATSVQLDGAPGTTLGNYKVSDDGTISGAAVPAGIAPGHYHVSVTTPAGTSVDGPVIEVLPAGTFYRSVLGISEGTYDFGTDHPTQRHLARLSDGTLLASYSGRASGGDVRFTYQLSRDGGRTWSLPSQFPVRNADFTVIWAASFSVSAGSGNQVNVLYTEWPGYHQTFARYQYTGSDFLAIAPKMPVTVSDSSVYPGPSVADSGDRIWSAYAMGNAVYAMYSTDGGVTWTQTPQISQATAGPPALTLVGGSPMVVYSENNGLVYAMWSGGQWTAPQLLPGPITGAGDALNLTSTSDGAAHLVAATPAGVQYLAFNGTSWNAATPVAPGATMPSLTTDGFDLWCFYVTPSKNIAYRRWRRDNASWDAAVAVTNDSLGHSRPATLPVSPDGYVPVVWTVGSAAPYQIHSASIPVQFAGAAALDVQAFAVPRLTGGKQTNLAASVLGGQPAYTYAWSAPSGSEVANSSSPSTAVTFSHAASYQIPVTVRDSTGSSSTAYVDVSVAPVATGIEVTPPSGPLPAGTTYPLKATITDQFGDPMGLAPPLTWSIAPNGPKGNIDSNGNFFPSQAGDYTITAAIAGGTSATVTITVSAATSFAPVLSAVSRTAITQDSATLQWATNIPSDSLVEYGFDTSYGSTASDGTLAIAHKIVLTGLSSRRIYHFRVHSKNADGKESVSSDLTFTTARN